MQEGLPDEYTLWLEPTGPRAETFAALIEALAKEAGGPTFLPHVTLLPAIHRPEAEILQEAERLAARYKAPELSLLTTEPASDLAYFKALYLPVVPSPELRALNTAAQKALRMELPYAPHLSLYYGSLPLEKARELRAHVATLALPERFTPSALTLWHAKGRPESWRRVATFPFKKA